LAGCTWSLPYGPIPEAVGTPALLALILANNTTILQRLSLVCSGR
jgi:hypothetical protein